jgi:CRISPR system Cascade subunit CasE
MYLSCFALDITDPSVRQCLRDAHDMHRCVMSGFLDVQQPQARSAAQVLYRLDGEAPIKLYVLSSSKPDWSGLKPGFRPMPQSPKLLDMTAILSDGRRLGFDLLAIPSKKVVGEGKNSRRVFLRDADDRLEWLKRKAEQNGFRLVWCREDGQRRATVSARPGSSPAVHTGIRFRGELVVTDSTRFKEAFQSGIGAGKAYGMGMLMLFPAGA